ncbi:Ca2+-dependent phosphoinositide-specific phospholipase C [Sphingomonas morindae]|uniref:Phosphatidylinositol-specific phospholipase C1-like protein n=1 Tax=Sphingomonas morindae TaxID=1541170 RepID=A0ABY4X947_9SPHN|nr:Ca2+-dependent phosphoinositide-specific phospholipase C [Sphingomonas morindae]USI73467.1 phosphatidylinositol-specific phospholipase C1-like protein [Sphingomonas morindae]
MEIAFTLGMALVAAAAAAMGAPDLEDVPLDEVQFVTTHNSYHRAPGRALLQYLRASGFAEGGRWTGPALARAVEYSRAALSAQLDQGIRGLELDVHDDPMGKRFVEPPFSLALGGHGAAAVRAWDPAGDRFRGGFKTFHKAAYDPQTSCLRFSACLREIARWSDRHPDHMLITLMIEVKPAEDVRCVALCDDGWRRLKQEIVHALGRDRLLWPINADQPWPSMRALRGKVMVMLLDSEAAAASYRRQTEREGDDLLFTARRPRQGAPLTLDGHARIAILPDPFDPRIAQARRGHMLVYTRADADTEEARANDPRRRDAAFASGATFIATDYPDPDRRFSRYRVRFAGGGYVRRVPDQ